jgi:Flp pilus assembly protein TadD
MKLMEAIPIIYFIVFVAVTLFVLISLVGKSKNLKIILVLWVLIIVSPVVLFFVNPGIFDEIGVGDLIRQLIDPKGNVKLIPQTGRTKKVNLPGKAQNPASIKPKPTDEASRQKSIAFAEKARKLWKNGELTDPNLALKMLDQAVSIDPNSAAAFNDRGKVHVKMGQYDRALKDYDAAIKIDPKFVSAYSNRGVVSYETNQYGQAVKDFNKAIVLNPSYAIAYLNRGLANFQMDRIDRACKDFTKACELGDCEGANWAKKSGTCKKTAIKK